MAELSSSFAEPAYITRLALKVAPFSEHSSEALYYSGGQLEHRFNLILHLIRASDKIACITAEHGLGKTSLLQQLLSRSGDDLRLAKVNVNTQQDSETILMSCLQDLGLSQTDIDSTLSHEENFKARLKQLKKLNIKAILIIDDAHKLNADLWNQIAKWLTWQNEDQYLLQAVITSVEPLAFDESLQSRIQHTDIPALNSDEVGQYLSERLTKAGYIGETLFTDKELKKIFNRTRGNPAYINKQAHQRLLGQKASFVELPNIGYFFNLRWLGALMFLLIFTSMLAYQDEINALFISEKSTETQNAVTVLSHNSEEIKTINIESEQIRSHQQAIRDELVELVEQIPTVAVVDKNIASQIDVQQVEEMLLVSDRLVEQEESLNPNQAEVPIYSDLKTEAWVLEQQGTDYTFQLMGSWEKQEVYDFIDKYALNNDVAMFQSLRNGRTWYALVYGVYESKDTALAASKRWPAPLNTLPSWLRRFDSVQKQIKGN
jgi:DamX protein